MVRAVQAAALAVLLASCSSDVPDEPAAVVDDTARPDTPTASSTPAEPTTAAERFGWHPRGGDEFDAGGLDLSKWRLYGGAGSSGIGIRAPEAVSVRNGNLVITGWREYAGGVAWHAQPATTYGRWEFRARVEEGTGYAPAILLWPDSDNWPVDGEIDVMEVVAGDRQENHTTVHYGADHQRIDQTVPGDFTDWHTYAVDWQWDRITVYIDGEEVFRTTEPAAIPHGPMHLAVQLDVGPQGTWIPAPDATTPETVSLYVDWVRMYH
ncbi:glycoside hydrolase family 16 protein [Geodermatophilus marinus]|uniref:glycoside hydrolase family 16 protein n=1 Tax=Geodermatophilus sp. LHW52908 TaxID=2303986 RepID=UPI001314BAA4|nr:glycoside hydrolase family 16 protein [Geodermatophilus sp. LHW52908]